MGYYLLIKTFTSVFIEVHVKTGDELNPVLLHRTINCFLQIITHATNLEITTLTILNLEIILNKTEKHEAGSIMLLPQVIGDTVRCL